MIKLFRVQFKTNKGSILDYYFKEDIGDMTSSEFINEIHEDVIMELCDNDSKDLPISDFCTEILIFEECK